MKFRKNQHFRSIAPKIFFVPNISPSKVGVIGVLIDKGVKRHKKHNRCAYCFKKISEINVCFLLNAYLFSTLKFNSLRDFKVSKRR